MIEKKLLSSRARESYLRFTCFLSFLAPFLTVGLIVFTNTSGNKLNLGDYSVVLLGLSLFIIYNRFIRKVLKNKIDVFVDNDDLLFMFKGEMLVFDKNINLYEITIFGYIVLGLIRANRSVFIIPKQKPLSFSFKVFWITKQPKNEVLFRVSKYLS